MQPTERLDLTKKYVCILAKHPSVTFGFSHAQGQMWEVEWNFTILSSVFLAPGELTLGRREKRKEERIKIESGLSLSLSGLNVFVGAAGGRRRILFPACRWWHGMAWRVASEHISL